MGSARKVNHALTVLTAMVAVLAAPAVVLASGGFVATGSMPTSHRGHTATLLSDGRVFVVCGSSGVAATGAAELYDPVTGTWTSAAARTPCIGSTATLLSDGRVIVAGNTGVFSAVSVYDPSTNT